MKKNIFAVVVLSVLGLWSVAPFDKQVPLDNKNLLEEEVNTLEYIKAKLSPEPISDVFQPVVIFQYNDNEVAKRGGVEKVHCYLAGSGTLVRLSDGSYRVVTAEHLFSVHREANLACPKYMVMVLREKNAAISRDIVEAKPFFQDKPGVVDVAVCAIESGMSTKITPFSPFHSGDVQTRSTIQHRLLEGKPEDLVVRSLVSGQEATLFCTIEIPGACNINYCLIDYHSVPGESGTGFVDRKGRLYVLKGTIVYGAVALNEQLKKLGAITSDRKAYSLVAGAFALKTK